VLFFTHIPFVVNHTFNATPPERLQHIKGRNVTLNLVVTDTRSPRQGSWLQAAHYTNYYFYV